MRRGITGLFPGQNAQEKGMGLEAYNACDESKRIFEEGCEATETDLKNFCWELENEDMTGPIVQPALGAAFLADLAWKRKQGYKPDWLIGQSVSEVIALGAAEAFERKDMFKILKIRGEAMDEAQKNLPSIMTAYPGLLRDELGWAIDYTQRKLTKLGKPAVWRAMHNSNTVHVAGGARESIELLSKVTKRLHELGRIGRHRPRVVKEDGASHTEYMAEAVPPVFEAIKSAKKRRPNIPVIANDGWFLSNPDFYAEYLSGQLVTPADMHLSMWVAIAKGAYKFIEVDGSNKKLLTAQMKRDFPNHKIVRKAFGDVLTIVSIPDVPYDIKAKVLALSKS